MLVLGPSGVGKTHLANNMAKQHNMLHVNFDPEDGDGVDIEGLRKEWNAFLDNRTPQLLADEVRKRVRLSGKSGAAITCRSGIMPSHDPSAPLWFLSKKYLEDMKCVGFQCVAPYGVREDCLAAYLCRERQTGHRRGKAAWEQSNSWWFNPRQLTETAFQEYVVYAFNDGHHRPVEEVSAEVRQRFMVQRVSG